MPPSRRYWNAQPPPPPPARVSCKWVEGQDPSCELTSVEHPMWTLSQSETRFTQTHTMMN
jgi:hypothetical protein